jgi:hypothetical protein
VEDFWQRCADSVRKTAIAHGGELGCFSFFFFFDSL